MADIDKLQMSVREAVGAGLDADVIQERLRLLEEAIRCDEREKTVSRIRHSLNTLRGLAGYIRQELDHSIEPLVRVCDELEQEAALAPKAKA